MLLEEYLKPLGLGQLKASKRLGISLNRLNEIVLRKRAITADTALRLARLLKRHRNCGCGCRPIGIYTRLFSVRRGGHRNVRTPDSACPSRAVVARKVLSHTATAAWKSRRLFSSATVKQEQRVGFDCGGRLAFPQLPLRCLDGFRDPLPRVVW
jgi:hypothetical protein